MNNKNDAIHNKQWIKVRQEQWDFYSTMYLNDESTQALKCFEDYMLYGDLDKFLRNNKSIDGNFEFIVNCSPAQNLDEIIEIIETYWGWVLEKPNERELHGYGIELNQRFMSFFSSSLILGGGFLPAHLSVELFLWVYGKTYDPKRLLPITLGKECWRPEIQFDIDRVCSYLMDGIRDYIFGYDNKIKLTHFPFCRHDVDKYKHLMDYFLSLFPYMDPDCYTKKYITKDKKNKRGRTIIRYYQRINRRFIGSLEGFLNEEEDIDILPVNDPKALTYLRTGLEKLKLSKRYYNLVEFVKEHKDEFMSA